MKRSYLLVFCAVMGLLASCGRAPGNTQTPTTVATTPEPTTPSIATPVATITPMSESPTWFRNAILYEIYPRSFYDSNGDSVGDLQGITSQLNYIQALGANTLLLTAVLSSTDTAGLEVTDFYAIAPSLGTKDDLAELARQAHNRKMHVVMDLVIAYTSDEFPRFREAYNKPSSPYSDWYQWTDAGHTAYKSYENVRARPLLNHKNQAVQSFLTQVAQDWLRLGVDGFRLSDVTDVPPEFLKTFRQSIKQVNPGAVLLGEVWERDWKKLASYFQDEFDGFFNVPLYYALAGSPDRNGGGVINGRSSPAELDAALAAAQRYTSTAQLITFASAPHTNRIASVVGQDAVRKRLAVALVFTLPGAPLIYYGDEIGMTGSLGTTSFAPMDWTQSGKGGGIPTWLKEASQVNKPNDGVSVEEQQKTKDSLWNLYKTLVTHRAAHTALNGPNFQSIGGVCKSCYAYMRWDENDFYVVAFNFSGQTQSVTLDLVKTPRAVSGPGRELIQNSIVSLPSNGRYTLTMTAWDMRVIYWGKP